MTVKEPAAVLAEPSVAEQVTAGFDPRGAHAWWALSGVVARQAQNGDEQPLWRARAMALLVHPELRQALPTDAPRAVLVMFHACVHSGFNWFPQSAGCPECRGTGFKGRAGVYELLIATDPIRDAIAAGADIGTLRKAAWTGGAMIDLARYAGILVGTGVTVPGEILHMFQRVGT